MELSQTHIRWLNISTIAMVVCGTLIGLHLSPGPEWLWTVDHCPTATASCTALPLGLIGLAVGLAGLRAALYLVVVARDVMVERRIKE